LNPAAKFYQADIRSAEISGIVTKEKPEVVFHLAAQIDVRKSILDPVFDSQINIIGGLNILENCRLAGVKKIVFSSTGGAIYGEADTIPTPEDFSPQPLSPYGINKLFLERYLRYYHKIHSLDYTILRFANVYGPRQFKGGEAGVIALFIENAVKGQVSRQFGDGKQTRDFVYVGDVVEALIKAKDVDYPGEINIGSGEETDLLTLRHEIAAALGADFPVKEEAAVLGEVRRSCLNRTRAREVLGWTPCINLSEGIQKTIFWAKSQK
jgi:UDP-glucose 4-epimerase